MRFRLAFLLFSATASACSGDTTSDGDDATVYPDLWDDTADVSADLGADTSGDVDGDVSGDAPDERPTDAPPDAVPAATVSLVRSWRGGVGGSPVFADCVYASPIAYTRSGSVELIATVADLVVGLSADDGRLLWSVELPEPAGRRAFAAATPALVGDRLVVAYQTHPTADTGNALDPGTVGLGAGASRDAHYAVVIDLVGKRLDPEFRTVTIQGSVRGVDGDVVFRPDNQFGRSDITVSPAGEGRLGRAYVTYGNVRDLQPWHGWAFELDLDVWREATDASAAVTGVFATTPETNCGTAGVSGSTQRVCGGGLWAPSGSVIVGSPDDYRVILAAGNGQLDFDRDDYANTLLKVGPGLSFERECDESACANFDSDEPASACVESCANVFVPRLLPGQGLPDPGDGACDGLGLFECWQQLDYIGGSTPAYVEVGEYRLLAYPTKDGHVYLVDYDHLGTLHDRVEVVKTCGAAGDPCRWFWAGMIVTRPSVVRVGGETRILVPAFMTDQTHPAGVVAFAVVVTASGPRLERRWEYPDFDAAEARSSFRGHPTRAATAEIDEVPVGVVGEPTFTGGKGRVHVFSTADGRRLASIEMSGGGYRFTQPIFVGNRLIMNSCGSDTGPGSFESFLIEVER